MCLAQTQHINPPFVTHNDSPSYAKGNWGRLAVSPKFLTIRIKYLLRFVDTFTQWAEAFPPDVRRLLKSISPFKINKSSFWTSKISRDSHSTAVGMDYKLHTSWHPQEDRK